MFPVRDRKVAQKLWPRTVPRRARLVRSPNFAGVCRVAELAVKPQKFFNSNRSQKNLYRSGLLCKAKSWTIPKDLRPNNFGKLKHKNWTNCSSGKRPERALQAFSGRFKVLLNFKRKLETPWSVWKAVSRRQYQARASSRLTASLKLKPFWASPAKRFHWNRSIQLFWRTWKLYDGTRLASSLDSELRSSSKIKESTAIASGSISGQVLNSRVRRSDSEIRAPPNDDRLIQV